MPDPTPEDEFGGTIQITCDYETYVAFWTLSQHYYTHEHAIRDLLRVADERPELTRAGRLNLDISEPSPLRWG